MICIKMQKDRNALIWGDKRFFEERESVIWNVIRNFDEQKRGKTAPVVKYSFVLLSV